MFVRPRPFHSALIELPESPQHRDWREAQEVACARMGEFREDVRTQLEQADQLLTIEQPPSKDWVETATQLRDACHRLGVAIYCLYEWGEPDDAQRDIGPGFGGIRSIRSRDS